MKIFLLLATLLFACAINAKDVPANASKNNSSEPQAENNKNDYSTFHTSQSQILAEIEKILAKLKKETPENPLHPTLFTSYAGNLDVYVKYPKLEKETKISKLWVEKLENILIKMAGVRVQMKLTTISKDKELYAKNAMEYKNLLDQFEKISKNPEKAASETK